MKRNPFSRRSGGGTSLWSAVFCDRFNSIAVAVILGGFLLELHMSMYSATFIAETTPTNAIKSISRDRAWKPRVVELIVVEPPRVDNIVSSSFWKRPWWPWNWHHQHSPRSIFTNLDDKDSDDDGISSPKTLFTDECIPQADWQTATYTTCNLLHELGDFLQHELLSLAGSWRSVWKVNITTTTNEVLVLKLLHLRRNFTPDSFYYARVDALAMEHLTFSPYVVNLFGFCGQSVLTEYAAASARDVIKDKDLSTLKRLQMARDLALALSHIHGASSGSSDNMGGKHQQNHAVLAHLDINIANVVQINDVLKFNDLNLAVLIPWNVTSQSPCGINSHFSSPLWESPEEIRNNACRQKAKPQQQQQSFDPASLSSSEEHNGCGLIAPDRSDVYALGNLLFQILTKHQPWTHLEPERLTIDQVVERKLAGNLPHVPFRYIARNTTRLDALYFATMACFEPDAAMRITARELAQTLDLTFYLQRQEHIRKVTRSELHHIFLNATYRSKMLDMYHRLVESRALAGKAKRRRQRQQQTTSHPHQAS